MSARGRWMLAGCTLALTVVAFGTGPYLELAERLQPFEERPAASVSEVLERLSSGGPGTVELYLRALDRDALVALGNVTLIGLALDGVRRLLGLGRSAAVAIGLLAAGILAAEALENRALSRLVQEPRADLLASASLATGAKFAALGLALGGILLGGLTWALRRGLRGIAAARGPHARPMI